MISRISSLKAALSDHDIPVTPSSIAAHITSLRRSVQDLKAVQQEHISRLSEAQSQLRLRVNESSQLRLQTTEAKTEVGS
jgi:hypothetical protein